MNFFLVTHFNKNIFFSFGKIPVIYGHMRMITITKFWFGDTLKIERQKGIIFARRKQVMEFFLFLKTRNKKKAA
jgi:hypothetical protein